MKIMGIDQSYSCTGIVVKQNDKLIYAEAFKSDKNEDKFTRCHNITIACGKVAKRFNVDQINIEGLAYGARGDATRDLGGLLYGIVVALQVVAGYKLELVPPNSLKKYATDNGKAKKEDMIAALPAPVRQYFINMGVAKTTGLSDLADSYWLASYQK